MRKNTRRKQRLKTALILLIILFILAGLSGMLFVSHKNKIEKEQRKEAALAALDSIPEVTATPVATATPVPTATPTPSLTPVPTILPAFEPENYQGVWYSEDGLTTINIYEISLKSVSFTYERVNGKNASLTAEADVTAEVAGNATQFRFKDSEGNKAKGEFVFDKSDELYMKVQTYERAEGSLTYPKTESIMTRYEPERNATEDYTAEENSAEAGTDTYSEISQETGGTSEEDTSYNEETYNENTYSESSEGDSYGGNDEAVVQEDSSEYEIPYGEEEVYYVE